MTKDIQIDDNDLPDVFFREVPRTERVVDPAATARIAAQHHYPALLKKQQQRREEKAQQSERRAAVAETRGPSYVKGAKKLQMYGWLRDLNRPEVLHKKLDAGEARFCVSMLAKFERYTPYNVKWITEAQYQWCLGMAAQHLVKV